VARAADELLRLRFGELLDRLAAEGPTPGAGAVAALTAGMAAGLVGMVAGASLSWGEAPAVAAQATALRRRLAPLAAANAQAYEDALASLALPESVHPDARSHAIVTALDRAADIPLRIVGAANDVAFLAAEAAHWGEPALRPDATAAALLAAGAARSAAHLVEVNLATGPEDERVLRARSLAASAQDCARVLLESAADAP
jgi:formiminotetrahydrofolate cyclodeaminase